jgi:hypothetical protein
VYDNASGEVLIGVNVLLFKGVAPQPRTPPYRGTASNKYGFYSLAALDTGQYTLFAKKVGYKPYRKTISILGGAGHSQRVDIKLLEEQIRLPEVTVEAEPLLSMAAQPATVTIGPDVMRKVPSLGGEPDLFRSLQMFPGVQSQSEINNGLFVRGGSPDQNLYLLDGAMIYNPAHLGGYLGTFHGEAVKDASLTMGAFPAEFGGRLSSVLDVTMRDGTRERISGVVGLSLVAARVMVEGPIARGVSFMVAGRSMYYDLIHPILEPSDETPQKYNFYDLNAKLNATLSPSDRLVISGFYSDDLLTKPEKKDEVWYDVGWTNAFGSARWLHFFSPSVYLSSSVTYTRYGYEARLTQEGVANTLSDFVTSSLIEDYALRTEVQWVPGKDHAVKTGLDVIRHRFDLSARDEGLAATGDQTPATVLAAFEVACYAQDEVTITSNLTSNIGARLAYYTDGEYLRFEPRLSLTYALTPNTNIKGSVALAHQFVHYMPTGMWYPATASVQPGRSLQGGIGVETQSADRDYLLSVEGYYKDLKDLYEFREGSSLVGDYTIEEQLTRGIGWTYGLEVILAKRLGMFTGWAGYAYSLTRRKFEELNRGRPYAPLYDRRHDISLLATLQLGASWEVSATWVFATGQPFAAPTGTFALAETPGVPGIDASVDYATRNAARLPTFHKLDLMVTRKFKLFGLPWHIALTVYNVYNRQNVYAEYVEMEWLGGTRWQPELNTVSLFSILPTIDIGFRF